MRRAVFGASPSSARIAPEVALRARNSSTCPSRTSTVITAAASKYTATAPCMSRKRRREQLRRQRCHHAVEIGDAGAHRDQREHVEIAREQRFPAALEERRTRPQHHRRRQDKGNPVRPCRRHQMHQAEMAAHLERRIPAASAPARSRTACVMSISSGSGASSSETCSGSSAMPQIGQLPGTDLPHLGMHRTGVDGAGGRCGLAARSRFAGISPARPQSVRGSARRRRNNPGPCR